MKIAVIGSGISGMAASWLLSQKYDVDCYEKNSYIGGHSNTVDVDYDGNKIAVDTGFIVFNKYNYPNLVKLFDYLGVEYLPSKMSFSCSLDNGNFEYAGTDVKGLFACKKNIFNPYFYRMLYDITRFNKIAKKMLKDDSIEENQTIGSFVFQHKFSKYFTKYYLMAMASAIWSCNPSDSMLQPAKNFIKFFYNHNLLETNNHHQWYTVKNGSREYIKKIISSCKANFLVNHNVISVDSTLNKVQIRFSVDNKELIADYDKVIFANHSNEISEISSLCNSDLSLFMESFQFQKNLAILHCDQEIMPKSRKVWASWNFTAHKNSEEDEEEKNSYNLKKTSFTYWMNNLQNIDKKYPLFVTLNPLKTIDEKKIFAKFEYSHPLYNVNSFDFHRKIATLQGKNNMYFCGAYLGYGFHEDGLFSAINVAKMFDVSPPWK